MAKLMQSYETLCFQLQSEEAVGSCEKFTN
jgi:hypothetical protein